MPACPHPYMEDKKLKKKNKKWKKKKKILNQN